MLHRTLDSKALESECLARASVNKSSRWLVLHSAVGFTAGREYPGAVLLFPDSVAVRCKQLVYVTRPSSLDGRVCFDLRDIARMCKKQNYINLPLWKYPESGYEW